MAGKYNPVGQAFYSGNCIMFSRIYNSINSKDGGAGAELFWLTLSKQFNRTTAPGPALYFTRG